MKICRSIYLRGRIFWGKFRVVGDSQLFQLSLGTTDRHVAEKKLMDLYNEREKEIHGLIPPRLMRESAARPLSVHLEEYLQDLAIRGRTVKHVFDSRSRILRVIDGCKWNSICSVSADSFLSWRSKQRKLAPKTLNEYLAACSAFLGWMQRNGRCAGNPLNCVQRVDTRGKERVVRRALLLEELRRLVAVDNYRGLIYFFAAFTGLRRREIRLLRWSDLQLEGAMPCVRVRASIAKNRRNAAIPLHRSLMDALLKYRAGISDLSGKVFPAFPVWRTVNADFARAGIPKKDADGRTVDFHALRGTFATLLNLEGVGPRAAMELMRHSDMRLTHKIYTDASVLPLALEVSKLPAL